MELALGTAAAVLTILVFRYLQPRSEQRLYAIALIIAALIYIGFSLQGKNLSWVLVEVGGTVLFTAIAVGGLILSPWFLVLGWIAHPVWDVMLYRGDATLFVPKWYPIACLSYDLVMAVYMAFKCIQWASIGHSNQES
jgi:hypothetical protein